MPSSFGLPSAPRGMAAPARARRIDGGRRAAIGGAACGRAARRGCERGRADRSLEQARHSPRIGRSPLAHLSAAEHTAARAERNGSPTVLESYRVGRLWWAGKGGAIPVVKVSDLAYARLQSPSLDEAEEFLTDFGMVRADRTADALYMRGTDAQHHIHVTHLGPSRFLGLAFHVESEADLRRFAKRPARALSRRWTSRAAAGGSW